MSLKLFENWLGKRIYDINNPLTLIVEAEIKKKQQVNKDHQKTTKDKYQRFPKEHYRSFAITTGRKEEETQNQRKTLDVSYVTKAINFQTVKLYETCQYKKDAKQ